MILGGPRSVAEARLGYDADMARYNRDLQAAVDATSVAKDAHTTTDLLGYLRDQLTQRDIETTDEDWLRRTVEAIEADPNYMVEDEPADFDAERPGQQDQ